MTRALVVLVDPELCVGSCTCVTLAPAVFALGDEGHAVVRDPAGADPAAILDAAANCPTGAILVRDAGSGAMLFPPPS